MLLSILQTMTRGRLALMQATISAADGPTWICAAARTGILVLGRPMLNVDSWGACCRHLDFCLVL